MGLAISLAGHAATSPSEALADYVAKSDASYGWRKRTGGSFGETRWVELTLTSQTWRDIEWQHQLYILKPYTMDPDTRQAILVVSGGDWHKKFARKPLRKAAPKGSEQYVRLAEQLQAPVAVLRQVPHQPLFGDMHEDEIIAYTFDQYLETGDEEWPLLLPMVKSAVRAMDAVQEYTESEWSMDIDAFTVTGASKRGWTTWLTGAVDQRVEAIAPMVIDVLNMSTQMSYQQEVWGATSEKIADYTERDIHKRLMSEEGQALCQIVDPYSYRQALTQPKLIIIGTNDRYWPVDALKHYWDDLQGPKYMLYVPNNRHSLKDFDRLIGSINALHRSTAEGEKLPDLEWELTPGDGTISLRVSSNWAPRDVVVWVATSSTRDFRESPWQSYPSTRKGEVFVFDLELPAEGHVAFFGEAVYEHSSGVPFYLSTAMRVVGATSVTVNAMAAE